MLEPVDHLKSISDFSEIKSTVSKEILNNVFSDNKMSSKKISDEIYNRLLQPITFGYIEAKSIHSLFDDSRYFIEKIGYIGGIYVAWVSYFDELCDKFPKLISEISSYIDESLLLKVLNNSNLDKNIFLENLPKDIDKKIIPLVMLWNGYISECRKLYNLSFRDDVWDEFVKTILSQYSQEIVCVSEKIPNFRSDLWSLIKTRSSSPLWVNFLINFLSKDSSKSFYLTDLKDSILKLGEVAKIIDDIIDISDDLLDKKWNYVLIKARLRYPTIFDKINGKQDSVRLIQFILKYGLIDESIDDARKCYNEALDDLKKMGLFTTDFEKYLKLFLSNWFKTEIIKDKKNLV